MSGLGSPAFRGTSRDSVTELRTKLAEGRTKKAKAKKPDYVGIGADLFGVASVLDAQPTLRRALTDPSRTADDRAGLAGSLFGGRIGAGAQEIVEAAVRLSWSRVRDLGDGIEYLAVLAEVLGAELGPTNEAGSGERRNALDELEDELFRFGRIVESNAELRAALSDQLVPADKRAELARGLLEGKAGPATVRLAVQAVAAPRGQGLLDALTSYGDIAAAWRERLVAVVRTAVALDDAQQQRLHRVLAEQYGQEVHLNVLVDPDVIGGIRIEIGDEVIDGSVATRLDEARRKLAG